MYASIVELGVFPLGHPRGVPSLQLAPDVAVGAAQVGEPDLGRIDAVEGRQHLGQRLARSVSRFRIEPGRCSLLVVERLARPSPHHVEMGFGDVGVVAVGDRLCHGHRSWPQRTDDAVLPPHVMGLGQQLAQRRASDHQFPSSGILEEIGQVGVATRQLRPRKRRCHVGDGRQPALDSGHIEADHFAPTHPAHAIGRPSGPVVLLHGGPRRRSSGSCDAWCRGDTLQSSRPRVR